MQAYLFNGEVVSIVSNQKISSGEYEVIYMDPSGKLCVYKADTAQEVDEDFVPTDQPYVSSKVKKVKPSKKDEVVMCNLVYYIGKKKIETVERNIPQKLAYALKNSKYKNNPTYRMGKFEVEPIIDRSKKISEKKEEGLIPHYTDPNKGNLGYNWKAVPDRDKKKTEGPNMLKISEIGIGDKNAVQKFKDWNGHYWERKGSSGKTAKKSKHIKEEAEPNVSQISATDNDVIMKFKKWADVNDALLNQPTNQQPNH